MKFRLAAILPTYLVMFVGCYYTAFLLRYDFVLPPEVKTMFITTVISLIGIKSVMCLLTGEWNRSYRYATLPDVIFVAASATFAAAVIYAANHFKLFGPIPRSVILIDWALTIPASGLVRIGTRLYTEIIRSRFRRSLSCLRAGHPVRVRASLNRAGRRTHWRRIGPTDDVSPRVCRRYAGERPVS